MTTGADSKTPSAPDFAALLPGLAGVIEDSAAHYRETGTAEDIHAIRVATRRARAALKLPLNAGRPGAEALAAESKWLADTVSGTRDADVLLVTVEKMVRRHGDEFAGSLRPLQQALVNTANLARGSAKRSLESKRFEKLIESLRMFNKTATGSPVEAPAGTDADTEPVSPLKALDRDHRRLRRSAKRALASGTEGDFHDMRIAAKKLRYSVEALSNGRGGKAPAKLLTDLRQLQDLLGEAHDLHVASDRVGALVERNFEKWDRETLKSAGMLHVELLKRADRLHGKAPAIYSRVSGKRWQKSARKLKKSLG